MTTPYSTLLILLLSTACNTVNDKIIEHNGRDSVILTSDNIPVERENVNAQPVKTYSETIKSFETTDEFKVSVFESKKTFHYHIKIAYKNLAVEDTLKVPNFGSLPSVEILKGDKRPSCILGFLDKNKQFRESKLVYFEDNKLKLKVLKHYGVYAADGK